jgi:branched-chain amino acid transport system substrate-binding protein
MVTATNGKSDAGAAIAAVSGTGWESPRGMIRIDPQTRDIVQRVYMRVVERDAQGRLENREIEDMGAVAADGTMIAD